MNVMIKHLVNGSLASFLPSLHLSRGLGRNLYIYSLWEKRITYKGMTSSGLRKSYLCSLSQISYGECEQTCGNKLTSNGVFLDVLRWCCGCWHHCWHWWRMCFLRRTIKSQTSSMSSGSPPCLLLRTWTGATGATYPGLEPLASISMTFIIDNLNITSHLEGSGLGLGIY